MTTFNMQRQQVDNQTNFGGDMNIGAIQNYPDMINTLEGIKAKVANNRQQGKLPVPLATDAEDQITKAIQQAEQAIPNKQTLLDHINSAKTLLESIQVAASIVAGLVAVAQSIQRFF